MYRFLYLAFLFLPISLWAQDPIYSQFSTAPQQLNPALAGLSTNPILGLNYRNQWLGIQNAYATYGISYNQYAPNIRSGFGMQLLADIAGNGIYNTYQIGAAYAYDIRFSEESYIRMGMEGNFVNKRLNWSKLVFLDQIDPMTGAVNSQGVANPSQEIPPITGSLGYFDAGLGIVVGMPYVHAGFSVKHINAPREGILNAVGTQANDELPIRYTFHAGSEINLRSSYNKHKSKSFISPNVLFIKQRDFYQLNIGSQIQINQFLSGLWLRHTFTNVDALIFMVGFQKGMMRLAYSYDLTLSRLGVRSAGTHEISLQFQFQTENNRTDYNDCLKIFR